MQSESLDNASGRTSTAESVADAETNAYVPPDPMLEIDRDTMRLLGQLADLAREDESQTVAKAVAAHHAAVFARPGPPPDKAPAGVRDASNPPHSKETTMRIAVKSAGGVTECFLHAENAAECARVAARQIAEDYGLPVDLELWSDPSDGGTPRRLGELRFVVLDRDGTVVELD